MSLNGGLTRSQKLKQVLEEEAKKLEKMLQGSPAKSPPKQKKKSASSGKKSKKSTKTSLMKVAKSARNEAVKVFLGVSEKKKKYSLMKSEAAKNPWIKHLKAFIKKHPNDPKTGAPWKGKGKIAHEAKKTYVELSEDERKPPKEYVKKSAAQKRRSIANMKNSFTKRALELHLKEGISYKSALQKLKKKKSARVASASGPRRSARIRK